MVKKEKLNVPKLRELFISEVKLMEILKSDNVVKLVDYIESPNTCYVVMEFCYNGDLEQYIQKKS